MNVVLWIVQGLLAFLYLSGGAYKVFAFDEVASQFPLVPRPLWTAFGVVEIVGSVLLVVPAASGWKPKLTPLAGLVLAVETLVIAAVYAQRSLDFAVTNPLWWALPMAIGAALVAVGRRAPQAR